jgi:uncharacterized protein
VDETLALADWRRRIAALYVDVRRLAERDPAEALDYWRAVRERLFREHPQSPIPSIERAGFVARHFPHDPELRFEVRVEPLNQGATRLAVPGGGIDYGGLAPSGGNTSSGGQAGAPVALAVSGGGSMAFTRFGAVTVPFPTGPRRLEIFWMGGYAGGLFLPFRDATNEAETYGAGRYLLDGAKGADLGGDPAAGTLILDFNFAFQPSCAWDPKYACPLSPPSNRLDVAIRAGERLP